MVSETSKQDERKQKIYKIRMYMYKVISIKEFKNKALPGINCSLEILGISLPVSTIPFIGTMQFNTSILDNRMKACHNMWTL